MDAPAAVIPYQDTGRAWVACGEAICPEAAAHGVVDRFAAAAASQGRRATVFGAGETLAALPRTRALRIGAEPVWDPGQWAETVRAHRSLREKPRAARAHGVTTRWVSGDEVAQDAVLRRQLARLVHRWLADRRMPPLRFLVDLAPLLADGASCASASAASLDRYPRMVLAERAGTLVGVLAMRPRPLRAGWQLDHLLRDPQAPNGTTTLLVHVAMTALAQEGVSWATLGMVPLRGVRVRWMRWARWLGRGLYRFDGLDTFKSRLHPLRWEPVYLVTPETTRTVHGFMDALRAFAGGPLWRFGVATLRHRRAS